MATNDAENEKKIKLAIMRIAYILEGNIKKNTPVVTGRLRSSIATRPTEEGAEIGTNVEYACVIGSRHQVYNPISGGSSNISTYGGYVLSKDGKSHKIKQKFRFSSKGKEKIEGIKIKTSKKRGVTLTKDHLVLGLRDNMLQWIEAKDLTLNDYVFKKRSHNAIVDGSNKTKFICICGNEFEIENYVLRQRTPKYCSQECRHIYGPHNMAQGKRWKLREDQIRYGEKNYQWRGGISFNPYDWRFNKRLKKEIKGRDNYTCQLCGETEKTLVVHHKDRNKLNSNPDNLITLCRGCHGHIHGRDCSLPSINLNVFKPVPIRSLEKKTFMRENNGQTGLPALYDFTIEGEDSFVVGGILVHNSHVEWGTSKMAPRAMFRKGIAQTKQQLGLL